MSLRNENRNPQLINPDIDDLPGKQSKCPKTWKVAVIILIVSALFLVGVVVGFYIAQAYEPFRARCSGSSAVEKYSASGHRASSDKIGGSAKHLSEIHEKVIDFIPNESPSVENVRKFADRQLHVGSDDDNRLVNLVREHFSHLNFDDLSVENYEVLLSTRDLDKPSRLLAFDEPNNRTIIDIDLRSHSRSGTVSGFVAYSPSAIVQGELVYLNHGIRDDYTKASDVELEGKIGLVRTGLTNLNEKVHLAECFGLAGLLVFEDSSALHHAKQNRCSDEIPNAVLHDYPGGDPSTPGFPAIDGVWHIPLAEVKLPKIPVQTLSCATSKLLLDQLRINKTVLLTDESISPITVRLEVNNLQLRKQIQNVIATIYGDKDSDYSILVGANRNSLATGDSGGIPGTELLLKVSSAISSLFHNDKDPWVPFRTIRFVSWGGGELGYLGFGEFLEKYDSVWRSKVVAYIDLDHPLSEANSLGNNPASQIIFTSSSSVEVLTKMVIEQVRNKDNSVPESVWQSVTRSTAVVGRDLTGVSTMGLIRTLLPAAYVHVQAANVVDKMNEDSENIDIVGRIAALLTLTFADSGVLQIQVHRTAQEITAHVNKLVSSYASVLPKVTTESFHNYTRRLKKSATDLEDFIRHHLEYERPEEIRMVNSVLLQLDSEITFIVTDAARILGQYLVNHETQVVRNDQCSDSNNSEFQLAKELSRLMSRIMSATKVTDMAG